MEKRMSWFGFLVAATISGLVIRVLGDPLVEMTSPQIREVVEAAQDFIRNPRIPHQVKDFLER